MQEVVAILNFFCNVDKYYLLGINLGLDDTTLKEIERDFPRDANRNKIGIFEKWRTIKPEASIEDLLKALENIKDFRTAENIKRQYCGEPCTHTGSYTFQNIYFDSSIIDFSCSNTK